MLLFSFYRSGKQLQASNPYWSWKVRLKERLPLRSSVSYVLSDVWLSSSILVKANHIGRYELSNRLDVLLKHHEQIIYFGFDPLILTLTVRILSIINNK